MTDGIAAANDKSMQRWGVEYYHSHFGWMRWEEGDTTYSSRETAVAYASRGTSAFRVVDVTSWPY